MTSEIIVRRSPMVLIRKFIVIEAVAFVLYLLALGGGGAKYEFYASLPVAAVFSYQTAKVLFLFGAQLLITIYAFLSWYYERYIIRPNLLSREWGVILKKKKEVALQNAPSADIHSGFFGKLFNYGSLRLNTQDGRALFILADIPSPKKNLVFISKFVHASGAEDERPETEKVLREDEGERLEFKSSLRFDHRTGGVNRELERAALKSVAAFLNSNGGRLLLGVDDSRKVVGLVKDYETIQRKNSDGFENHFTQVFNSMIGPEFRYLVKLWFDKVEGQDICIIEVTASARPVYLKIENNEHFYVRTGNTTTALKLSEVEAYSLAHWPEKTNLV